MALDFEAPETMDTGGGNWLKEPGTYHAIIIDADESPASKSGAVLDAFRVTIQILDGTVEGQRDKQTEITFWHPKLTDKNEGLFARQKQAKFFIATGLMDEGSLGKGVTINLPDAVGRQVVLTVDFSDDEKKYLDLHFADIWHVDDPEAAKFPRCAESLKLLPAAFRRKPDSFTKKEGNGQPATTKPAPKPAAAVDLSDL